jgi:poly-beta-hydroxyalkanoate depolymerase
MLEKPECIVGHYGVFRGRTWQQQIYPMVKNVILLGD